MLRRLIPLLAAFTALPLFAVDLVRLPPPPIDSAAVRDSVRRDSVRIAEAATDTLSDTVTYSAPRIRFRGDRFSLAGGALLKYKGSTLRADSIMYYSDDDVVDAYGAPVIEDPSNPSIQGYRMRYNLKNRVGTLYYGSSEKDGQTFNGIEVRRQTNSDIYISRGDLSTCDATPEQHYYFYGRRMIVEPDSKVLSGPIVLNIADVPVAVLPMMVVPLGKGRRSGVLQPKFGGDQSQGYYLQGLGYYWAISDYQDFQVTTDIVEGAAGTFDNTNVATTYRWNKLYVWSGLIDTKLYLPQFQPANAGGIIDFSNDLNLTPDGKQTLKGEGTLVSSATIVSDNALNEEQAKEQTANASLGYRRVFYNNAVFNAGVLQNYNLTQNHIDRNIPDLSFQASGPLVPESEDDDPPLDGKDPWYRNWNWNYGNHFNVNQVIKPTLLGTPGDSTTYVGYSDAASLTGKYTFGYLNLTPSLSGYQLWSAGERGDSADPYRSAVNPASGRYGQYFAGWNASIGADTHLYGVAQSEGRPWNGLWLGEVSAIRHTITPSLTFTYAPKIDSNPAFFPNPKTGGTAFQAEQQSVTFSLANDVSLKLVQPGDDSLKKKPELYTLLSMGSNISYNFAADVRRWSDLSSNLNLYALRNLPLTLSTTHRVYDDFTDTAGRNRETSPILQSWSFGYRRGLEVGGGFSTGLRMRNTGGAPTDHFEHTAWSASMNYSIAVGETRVGSTGNGNPFSRFFIPLPLLPKSEIFQRTITHQASAGLKINPTEGWQMTYDTDFNFTEGEFSRHSFGFERTLHCWQMVFHWNPVGVTSGWDFVIRIIDLPDIKLETRDSRGLRG